MGRSRMGQELRDQYPDGAAADDYRAFANHRSEPSNRTNCHRGGLGQCGVPDVDAVGYGDEPARASDDVLGESTVKVLSCHDELRAQSFLVPLAPVAATTTGHDVDDDMRAFPRARTVAGADLDSADDFVAEHDRRGRDHGPVKVLLEVAAAQSCP
ncbi:hypothetical protein Raf01_54140 [Rugosimonospora africana]|uniref:Uncharacterized protein n=1 Tax=Rugosimonospora africana TaxID=556532 RepID=A0A8J3QWB2_9ACTN|nr:hypothetical protein Raf01_54140 [Rugosimonospora africana]